MHFVIIVIKNYHYGLFLVLEKGLPSSNLIVEKHCNVYYLFQYQPL